MRRSNPGGQCLSWVRHGSTGRGSRASGSSLIADAPLHSGEQLQWANGHTTPGCAELLRDDPHGFEFDRTCCASSF
jgi:hypothetical protein